jgi:hypothetical protein
MEPDLSRRWRQRGLESVIDPVRPVGRRDDDHELDDLFLGQMLAETVQVNLLDVPRAAVQEVGEPQDRPLFSGEDIFSQPSPRFLQRLDLLFGNSSPLPRSGVGARSIGAAVQDGDPEVRELLALR